MLHRGKNKHTIVPIQTDTDAEDLSKQRKRDEASEDAATSIENSDTKEKITSDALANVLNNESLKPSHAGKRDDEDDQENHVINDRQLAAAESIYLEGTLETDCDLDFERKIHIEGDVENCERTKLKQSQDDIPDIRNTETGFTDENDIETTGTDWGLYETQSFDAIDGRKTNQNISKDNREVANISTHASTEKLESITESDETDFITLRQKVDIRFHETETECDISDIAILPNGDIVLADTGNERLKVITPMDNKRKYKFDSWPWNIALSSLNDLDVYVTLPDLRQIVLMNIDAHFEKTRTITTSADCWGIVSTKGGLIVSLWNENTNSGFIQLLSQEGDVLKTLGNDAKMRKFLAGPSFLAINQIETILCATDAENKAIHMIQIDNNKLNRYLTFHENNYGYICGVAVGSAVGADEVLYVADFVKKCIYKIMKGNGGKYQSTTVLSDGDGLDYPRCVYFDNQKKSLFICGFSDSVEVFK